MGSTQDLIGYLSMLPSDFLTMRHSHPLPRRLIASCFALAPALAQVTIIPAKPILIPGESIRFQATEDAPQATPP
jgi:hypothetical protein